MITDVHIQNFKSIHDLKLKLGRVTVLIGENGCGKSNILEAIAFASAAAENKLDNEFLASRGIRVTEPRLMTGAFREGSLGSDIKIIVEPSDSKKLEFILSPQVTSHYVKWIDRNTAPSEEALKRLAKYHVESPDDWAAARREIEGILEQLPKIFYGGDLLEFLIYSPENSALRTFEREGQILPLGINGEGLFKLIKVLSAEGEGGTIAEIKDCLRLIEWFEDFHVATDLSPYEATIRIKDRYLSEDLDNFDQRSANEGFLFLLFYFALFIDKATPSFFAIDNIDASLNPKLCIALMQKLVELSAKHGKQVILTTHNPAVLDGLNLHDDEQRLFVIYRNSKGHTKARRVTAPEPLAGEPPTKLSEAFLGGLIGGLPKNF